MDNVTFQVGSSGTKEVELTEGATGKWTGTFTIEESDITDFGFTRYLPMYAEAEMNGSTVKTAENAIYMYDMSTEESLLITSSLDPPSVYMGPGDTKTITWEVRRDGTLVDPTTIDAVKYEGAGDEPIELTKSSTGVYTYSYTMPNGPRSMRVEFEVMATLDSGGDTIDGDSDMEL
ncbi:MAG: hypothetical protein GWN18_10155, partial [Thermoplasmata archaeon]|nr:hypothetical protein [Thermoplasmata archaeon]NIS12408.1 hypothetical protein [Thermoplasmata archaeon]NIS20327.1 hypothetical protein [Thermoplasmata archaeon]NIT79236.1 hypothetical protein [Thermoplasmata archaeon]NIU49415.1 hypothetical protein [Thermoplasmata archaeon]